MRFASRRWAIRRSTPTDGLWFLGICDGLWLLLYGWCFIIHGWWSSSASRWAWTPPPPPRGWAWTPCLKLTDGLNHPMVSGWWLMLFFLVFSAAKTVCILLSCSWSQPPSGLWLMVYAWWFVVDFYGGSYGWCFKCSWWLSRLRMAIL